MTTPSHFTVQDFADFCARNRPAYHAGYYAMYSSWWNAITTDPNLMVVPVDDHMVHRGDGLFETFKCVDGAIYNLMRISRAWKMAAAPSVFICGGAVRKSPG